MIKELPRFKSKTIDGNNLTLAKDACMKAARSLITIGLYPESDRHELANYIASENICGRLLGSIRDSASQNPGFGRILGDGSNLSIIGVPSYFGYLYYHNYILKERNNAYFDTAIWGMGNLKNVTNGMRIPNGSVGWLIASANSPIGPGHPFDGFDESAGSRTDDADSQLELLSSASQQVTSGGVYAQGFGKAMILSSLVTEPEFGKLFTRALGSGNQLEGKRTNRINVSRDEDSLVPVAGFCAGLPLLSGTSGRPNDKFVVRCGVGLVNL